VVLELPLVLPPGVVAEPLPLMLPEPLAPPDGVVALGLLDELELEPVVVSDERGVVAVPGDADGLVRSEVPPTRSVSA
jgi:hypothetical protein